MAGRGKTSYQKKLKEQARLEKRQQKAAKKQARKSAKGSLDSAFVEEPLDGQEEPLSPSEGE